jgi:hypothetical protein
MTDQMTPRDIDCFLTKFEDAAFAPAASLGSRFLAALGDLHPSPETIAQILPRITQASALMLNHPALAILWPDEDWYPEHAHHPDANVVLFSDGSFLHFDFEGSVCNAAPTIKRPIDLDGGFLRNDYLTRVSATSDILQKHADPTAWFESLPSGFMSDDPTMHDVDDELYNARDPIVDPADYHSMILYTDDDLERLRHTASLCWTALDLGPEFHILISSARIEGQRPTVSIGWTQGLRYFDKSGSAFAQLLNEATDLSAFVGHEYHFDDAETPRISTCRQVSIPLFEVKAGEWAPSHHHRLTAKDRLLAQVQARGGNVSKAAALLSDLPGTIIVQETVFDPNEIPF